MKVADLTPEVVADLLARASAQNLAVAVKHGLPTVSITADGMDEVFWQEHEAEPYISLSREVWNREDLDLDGEQAGIVAAMLTLQL